MASAAKISPTDVSNFEYYTDIIERGYSMYSPSEVGKYAWLTAEYQATKAAEEVANAIERIAGAKTATEYQIARRDACVARVQQLKANGHYDVWCNEGWCGRLDLAQKLASKSSQYGVEVTILEARVKG
jgi:hypothetical protein